MSAEKSRLTVLFTPLDSWGHINGTIGLAEELLNRGHRIVFAVDKAFKDKLSAFGFEEELMTSSESEGGAKWAQVMEELSNLFESKDPAHIARTVIKSCRGKMIDDIILLDTQYTNIILRVNPDLIVIDNYVTSPAITNSGRPWIFFHSASSLTLYNLYSDEFPPSRSGYPSNDTDKTKWVKFNQAIKEVEEPLFNKLNQFFLSQGAPPLPSNVLLPVSPYLNIYLYVKELDYNREDRHLPQTYVRADNFLRIPDEKFEIPQKLLKLPGSLIFLSLGTFCSSNVELMTRLTRILSKSKHRYIVSKGPNHDKYELPDNMWGQRFLPQLAVLPLVDLVISHGGNNTLSETLYFGKPLLVMPIDGDQYDNAQRITETGHGLRLNPFHCTEEELISSVDKLVSDQSFAQKCKTIGKRIRGTNDKKRVADIIENIK